jgi:hypothetical protein
MVIVSVQIRAYIDRQTPISDRCSETFAHAQHIDAQVTMVCSSETVFYDQQDFSPPDEYELEH